MSRNEERIALTGARTLHSQPCSPAAVAELASSMKSNVATRLLFATMGER